MDNSFFFFATFFPDKPQACTLWPSGSGRPNTPKTKSRKKNTPKTKSRKLQKSEGKNKIANIKTDFLSHNDIPMYSRMSCIKKLRKFFRELFKRRPFKLAQRKFPGTKNIATNVENATVRRETKKKHGKIARVRLAKQKRGCGKENGV